MAYIKLTNVLKERGMTKFKLSKLANIAEQDIYSAFNGRKPFYPNWRKRISEVLEVSETELFDDSGPLDEIEKNLFCEYVYYDGTIWYVDSYDDETISLWKAVIYQNHLIPTTDIIEIPTNKYKELKLIDIESKED